VPDVEAAADEAIEICGGDARAAVKALLAANDFLERYLRIPVASPKRQDSTRTGHSCARKRC
jgi:hypothetical protein